MKKSEFDLILNKVFRPFETKFHFKRSATAFVHGGFSVQFLNDTTEITLHYKIGNEPWFTIADLQNPENSSTLEWLLVERGVAKAPAPEQAFHPVTFHEAFLEPTLVTKREQLSQYAADLFQGDFSLMPALQKRAAKYERDCKRYIALHTQK